MTPPTTSLQALRQGRVGRLMALFLIELVVLALAYQLLADFDCRQVQAAAGCGVLRSMVARAVVVLAVMLVLILARPAAFARFAAASAAAPSRRLLAATHVLGVALMFLPLAMAWRGDLGAMFDLALWPWLIGAVLAVGAGLLWVAPARAYAHLLAEDGYAMLPILFAAALVPDVADAMRPLWGISALTQATFAAVAWVLRQVSAGVYVDAEALHIGLISLSNPFVVHVGEPCSGVEGFALVAAFVAIYGFVFRKDLRFPRYWIVVLPLGLLASWLLNVLRIALLILIGARVSPDLAVNGFHSYAGWLFFTLLALLLVWAVERMPWLHRAGRVPRPALPLRDDLVAACLLPFVVLTLTGALLSAVLIQPDLGYPIKVAAMAAALAVFAPALRRLPWAWDWPAVGVGGLVGLVWVATAPAADAGLAAVLAELPAATLAVWIGFRLAGTVLLIPVIEELFFRGYLLARLDGAQPLRRALAIAVSSAAFALLHGRWLEAGLAGVLFAAIMLRRGRVTDAILAHVVANLIVAASALLAGDFSLI